MRCRYRENGYTTMEKAYLDTVDHEHMIKHSMNFDSGRDKWIVLWEHEFNELAGEFKKKLGECLYDLPDKLNPCDAVKGGCTKVFRMHIVVCNPNRQMI